MHTKRKNLVVLLLVFPGLFAVSQEADVPQVSIKPLQYMQKLADLAGEWTMTTYLTSDNGDSWNSAGSGPVSLQFVHKGFMLEEIPGDLESPGFHMRTMITYDQYRDVYRKAALDDIWGIFDLYEGNMIDGRLVLDNLKSETFFPVENGAWRGFRLTIELDAKHRWMMVDQTDDNGESWQPMAKVEYRRD